MLFRRIKSILSVSRKTRDEKHLSRTQSNCSNAGKHPERVRKYRWLIWLFPIAGLLSLIWFLIRVLPKPSRATYPCQRVAAPLASSFVIWITGLIGSTLAYRKARRFFHQSRYILAGMCIAVSVAAVWLSFNVAEETPAQAAFTPSEPANSPIGEAKGIYPGRVVWVHDPVATSWDGSSGRWWDDDNTNQGVVDYMVSDAIQTLTGQLNDANAWDALFRHFNQTRDLGDAGYQQGEKIAIKINMNQDQGGNWSSGAGHPSPHVIYSLVEQLINVAGVPGSAITIYDASRYIGDPIYDKVRGNPDPNFQNITFNCRGGTGRIRTSYDNSNPLYTRAGTAYLPQSVTEAKYLINMALLRPHSLFGITLTAKNHFGSTYFQGQGWTPSPMHNYGLRINPMGSYNCLVELNGHEHLGGKTLLYMIDALYSARNQSNNVVKWMSFDNDWCSSIFASQDQVAIDSVGLDFLRYEDGINAGINDVTGNPENYLHEAALADNPPSGTVYDPEGDGTRLSSLGVHEHWNNPVDKQYSRNLGTGNGIELVIPSLAVEDGPIENVTTGKKYINFRHAITEAVSGDHIVANTGIYYEKINLRGKSIMLSSIDPNDPDVVEATVIDSGGADWVVTFSSGEDANCVLTGFTITNANEGIYCSEASPTISKCIITDNDGTGIGLHDGSNPFITQCLITCNSGSGIEMYEKRSGRLTVNNFPTITNCIIVENHQNGISGDMPTIINCTIAANIRRGISSTLSSVTNSIIYYNSADSDAVQIESDSAVVTYSDIQGGYEGEGNINEDPCFAEVGFWDTNGTPEDASDDFWIRGDYHLQSQAGRWDPNSKTWIQDNVTSPCIDTGNQDSDYSLEPLPNGEHINMGAYGGTTEASKS